MQEHQIPISVVGSTIFGRYPKISVEQTYNMIISDDWIVPSAGYAQVIQISDTGSGRGIYHSSKLNSLIVVVDNNVYVIGTKMQKNRIGSLDTYTGDVFIAENDNNQIAICDLQDIYIYNSSANTFTKAVIDFYPGFLAFQDGYFVSPDLSKSQWRLSALNDGTSWPSTPNCIGTFQTKADNPMVAISVPGRGGNLFIMGSFVTELWNDVGAALFPYQRATGFNIDYGCLNATTIAAGDNFVIWLGVNEKSGPVIMYSTGGGAQQISTDGINFRLSQLVKPSSAYGYIFKQDGHLMYNITFYDPADNFTLTYDFNTEKFFSLCDENMDHHIVKRVAAFNNSYYFVSFIDGNLYELNSKYTNYSRVIDGQTVSYEIPRLRVTASTRSPDNEQFIATKLSLLLEQGAGSNIADVKIALSRDGGVVFGNYVSMTLNRLANRMNKFFAWSLGSANELVIQFRFYSDDRFVVSNALLTVQQQ